ncbi:MAG: DUF4214 domain-containing protein [Pseudomonadota bacterium]
MPRNPVWTDANAADFANRIATDDGQTRAVVIDDPEESSLENGRLDAITDEIDFVELVLERDTIYTVVGTGGTEPVVVSIFDDEGYLLEFVDAGDLGIDEFEVIDGDPPTTIFFDTISQFRPDETGTYYVAINFLDPNASGPYQVAVDSQSGVVEGSNTTPVGIDDLLVTTQFEAALIDPLGNDFDADSDALTVTDVAVQPGAGVAFVVDGQVLFRSDPTFAGRDSFDVTISDGNGGMDVERIFVDVNIAPDGEEATASEAQLIAYLYEAGLNRDGNIDLPGLNFWIDVLEGGAAVRDIAGAFLTSNEFTEAFGAVDTLSDLALVEELYRNVLDREGEQAGIDFWTGQLGRPEVTREDMLIAFAESTENMVGSPDTATLVRDVDDWVFA